MKIIFQILLIFCCVICFIEANNDSTSIARKKKLYYYKYKHLIPYIIWYGFGFHALAILYWLKVKAVIIAFIVGTAIVWGARYIFANKSCPKEIIHEGPVIPFSHGPLWSSHDHIPYSPSFSPSYSFDHHHDHGIESFPSSSFLDTSPSSISGTEHFASDKKWKRQSRESRQLESEEQISTIFFTFLGVDSDACRRRFVCEWEFKSKRTPITNLVFRVFGRGIFTKYLKNSNEIRTFDDCGRVHNECRFIEQHIPEKEYEDSNEENINTLDLHNTDRNDEVSNSEDENENKNNEIESSTLESDGSNEKRDENDKQNKDISKNSIDHVKKNQPEVKLYSISNKGVKNKNIIAETLFNRSRSKLRVIPARHE
ncbi:uncharacterized protein LOC129611213 [Condylostylus longicornis]|uniref:uncharacterized protein LOC129611213 n=1 Tax=Condylostylus longicornis TaxID=2530218 RepID=UPI00244E2DD5|nr:uncharacterized protein LOC129611213 [Condylostylus longicornis]